MLTVTITIAGSSDVVAALKRFEGDLNDWTSTFDNIGDYLVDVYGRQAFMTEGAVFGKHWARLSPEYEAWKAVAYAGRGILERSGDLAGGFQKHVTSNTLEIKNTVPYAVFHQHGTRRMPARPVIGMDGAIERKIVGFFVDGVSGKIRRAFN